MVAKDDAQHFFRLGLCAVFVIAVLALTSFVVLVGQGPALPQGRYTNTVGLSGKADIVQANAAGAALTRPKGATLQYTGFDSTDRIATFVLLPDTRVSVAIAPDGSGTLVLGGYAYAIALGEGTGKVVLIDTNHDGALDDKVKRGGYIKLA